jgi:hypothetical protein
MMPPQPQNRFALKEWAVVVEALATGRQLILLRKGGIREDGGGFRLDHREFFLFPTYFHEQAQRVIPEAAAEFARAQAAQPPPERVVVPLYATVEEAVELTDRARLAELRPHHILTDAEVERRFQYRNDPRLWVLIVRAYRLAPALELALTAYFEGCRSWVDLGHDLPTGDLQPVLDDASFRFQIGALRAILL